jgi:exodeoxyribonuclease VII large subunit
MTLADRQILTVTQLNRLARQLLETHLSLLWIEGEISNLVKPASGHCYFTLKDTGAQVRCAMFKNRSHSLRITPQNGMKVLIRGRISLYEGRGDYQLIVEHMEDAGLGALQRAFDALRDKLSQEGLFSDARKRALPLPARHIALVTSASGAALQDILAVFKRRWPGQSLTLIPTLVQGSEAVGQIINAIDLANRADLFDVILLARGGGSLEDLWCFNSEALARAIAASPLPIITGIGHETDTTIADFAADFRAPTPTAAAELLSPDKHAWDQKSRSLARRVIHLVRHRLQQAEQQFDFYQHRLTRCRPKTEAQGQAVDHQAMQLNRLTTHRLKAADQRLQQLHAQLQRLHPAQQLARANTQYQQLQSRLLTASPRRSMSERQRQLSQLHDRLHRALNNRLQRDALALAVQVKNLHNLSPLQTLHRGFALAEKQSGELLRNSRQVTVGERVSVRLAEGQFSATVDGVMLADSD